MKELTTNQYWTDAMMEFFITVIILSVFFSLMYYLMKSKSVYLGYKTIHDTSRGITKNYGPINVTFYHWGSLEISADGNDPYLGFYGFLKVPREMELVFLKDLFDEVEIEDVSNDKSLISVKKEGVFIGGDEFKQLLEVFDRKMLEL